MSKKLSEAQERFLRNAYKLERIAELEAERDEIKAKHDALTSAYTQETADLKAENARLVKITEYYRRGVKVIYDLSHDEVTADRAHHLLENEPK